MDPPLLADLLVRLLDSPMRFVHRSEGRANHECDVAIVSPGLRERLDASVVIVLPDDEGRGGVGAVQNAKATSPARIDSLEDLEILLLDGFGAPS